MTIEPSKTKVPTLTTPDQFPEWLEAIQHHVDSEFWEYFDPDGEGDKQPVKPIQPIPVSPPPPAMAVSQPFANTRSASTPSSSTEPTSVSARKAQQEDWENYCRQRSIYIQEYNQYKEYRREEASIRSMIYESVPSHLYPRSMDRSIPHPRDVLIKLGQSMSPDPKAMKRKTEEEYDRFIRQRWRQWPIKGPDTWIDEWVKLMKKCWTWVPDKRDNWATIFIEVWDDHPDLNRLISWIELLIREDRLESEASIEILSNEIRSIWDRKRRQQGYNRGGAGAASRTTRAVFNTTFDGQLLD